MATKIILKKSSISGNIPTAEQLDVGEVAVNLADQKLYSKTAAGDVVEIGGTAALTSFTDISYIDFDTTATVESSLGRLTWNSDDQTLDLGLADGVVNQLGQEIHMRVKASELINNGDVVYASGAVGNSSAIEVSKYIANNTIDELYVVGVATQNIALGDFGYITTFGKVRGISTDGSVFSETWVDGTVLYASPTAAGGLTSVQPVAPNQDIPIAMVLTAHATNGTMFVRSSSHGYHLGELHDVHVPSPSNNNLLKWNATNERWEAATVNTTEVAEGANLYYTTTRANSAIDTRVTKSFVDDLNVDADTLDGLDSTSFLRSNSNDIHTYNTAATADAITFRNLSSGGSVQLGFQQTDTDGTHHRLYIKSYKSNAGTAAGKVDLIVRGPGGSVTSDVLELESGADAKWQGNVLWSAGNDGSGSGLDADLLDGQQGSYYTNYTDTAIANLIDSSPATLDTLNELAAALGDDPNFATTVTNNIATKVSKSGDTMTGALDFNSITGRAITITADTTLDGADASIYLGNSPSSYGFDITYEGTGTGNTNAFVITSTNAGSPKELIRANQDGIVNLPQLGAKIANNTIFHDGYHPNADKWTTARTITLGGDLTGSVSIDGSANVTLNAEVTNNSHTHDDRYYTETESDSRFVNVTGDTMTGNLSFGDNDKAIFGAGSDLQIYHTGGNSNIADLGTGNLVLQTNGTSIKLQKGTTETLAEFIVDGAVDLYHNNNKKLATTSTGVDITGTLTSDGLTVAETDSVTYSSSAVQGDLVISRKNSANTVNQVVGLEFDVTGWSGSTTGIAGISAIQTGSNLSSAALAFQTRNDGVVAERLRITSDGSIGIGTSSPAKLLHLKSAAPIMYFEETDIPQAFSIGSGGGKFFVYDETDARQPLTIDGSGNVGIGTSSPSYPLAVDTGAGTFSVRAKGGSSVTLASSASLTYFGSTHEFYDAAGTSARMTIDASGNFLVGTTSANTYNTTAGFQTRQDGLTTSTRDGAISLILNRLTSDGTIADFRKNGTTVGSIGTHGGDKLTIGNGDVGVAFNKNVNSIYPWDTATNAPRDANVDLGYSDGASTNIRFRDLYLSGKITSDSLNLSNASLYTDSATTSSTTQTAISTFNASTYGSAEVLITAKTGVDRHVTKLLIVHDGTTASATEYGTVWTSSSLATYEVDISGGNVRILATGSSATSTVYNVALTLMEA